MAYIDKDDVQDFIEETKFTVDAVPPGLEAKAVGIIFGILKARFDVVNWTDENSTPETVKTSLAMLVGSWMYSRGVSYDEAAITGFAKDLRDQAYHIAHSLVEGSMNL